MEIGYQEKLARKNEQEGFYFTCFNKCVAECRDEKSEYTIEAIGLNNWKEIMVGYGDFRMVNVRT